MASNSLTKLRKQTGTIIVLAALSIFMLAGFTALALDSSLLFVARNELQNAADAGALAGARMLYLDDGTAINLGTNQIGHDTAEANNSQNTAVEVNWTTGNVGDVQRGHWSFATRQFTANASLAVVDLFNVSTAELDADTDFINAVKVTTRRQATPVQSIFANFLGVDSSVMEADAVAYIGFSGSVLPDEMDQPMAICEGSLTEDNDGDGDYDYICSVGTFIPSSDAILANTGGWTNFDQDNPCQGGTNSNEVTQLVCPGIGEDTNEMLKYGYPMGTIGGQVQSAFMPYWNCWDEATNQEEPWQMKLPVIRCDDNNVGPCNDLIGTVVVNVIFVLDLANDIGTQAPRKMDCTGVDEDGPWDYGCESWSYSGTAGLETEEDGIARWNEFVGAYDIMKPNGAYAEYNEYPPDSGWRQKTIYFLPSCTAHIPSGTTGGQNFGVLARIPVLVQ